MRVDYSGIDVVDYLRLRHARGRKDNSWLTGGSRVRFEDTERDCSRSRSGKVLH
jgi:hypothetical protein